jgi:hypothetical protein
MFDLATAVAFVWLKVTELGAAAVAGEASMSAKAQPVTSFPSMTFMTFLLYLAGFCPPSPNRNKQMGMIDEIGLSGG